MLYKYTLCTSGGIVTAILTYNILLYRDRYNNKIYNSFHAVYSNFTHDIYEKLIFTTFGFFTGAIITSKLIKN